MPRHFHRRWGALGGPILGGLPAVVLLTMGYRHRWVTEDAFIDFRVVQHLLAGHGPVFNLGERVEAYSNPLWLLLLSLWGLLGGRLETGAIALGLCLSAAAVLVAQTAATHRDRGERLGTSEGERPGFALPIGTLIVAAVPVFWDFATSGLETALSLFWLAACSWLSGRTDEPGQPLRPAGVVAAIVRGLGPLIRPDLGIFSVVFVGAAMIRSATAGRSWRAGTARALTLGASSVVLPAAYQLFRMGYFADLVPNPALAKESGLAFTERGLAYAWDLASCYALPLPLGLVACFTASAAWRARHEDAWGEMLSVLAPVTGGLLHAAYVIRVGGDFMHGRLLLPALFAFILPVASVRMPRRGSRGPSTWIEWSMAAVMVIWACVSAAALRFHDLGVPWGIVDERAFYVEKTGLETPTRGEDYDIAGSITATLAETAASQGALVVDEEPRCQIVQVTDDARLRYCTASSMAPVRLPLRRTLDPRIKVVLVRANVGAVGYALGPGVNIVDRRGLGDALASRLRLDLRGRAGHEKMLGDAWLVARFAEPDAAHAEHSEVVAARAALGCGDLSELLRATEGPLDFGRFIQNIGLSFRLHALRVSEDPSKAREELCTARNEAGPAAGVR